MLNSTLTPMPRHFASYWRHAGRQNRHDRHFCPLEAALLHVQDWQRQYFAVAAHVGELEEEIVRNRQTGRRSIVSGAEEKDTGHVAVGEVVGKRTDGLARLVAHAASAERFLALHAVLFQIVKESLQFSV